MLADGLVSGLFQNHLKAVAAHRSATAVHISLWSAHNRCQFFHLPENSLGKALSFCSMEAGLIIKKIFIWVNIKLVNSLPVYYNKGACWGFEMPRKSSLKI